MIPTYHSRSMYTLHASKDRTYKTTPRLAEQQGLHHARCASTLSWRKLEATLQPRRFKVEEQKEQKHRNEKLTFVPSLYLAMDAL